MPKSALSAPFAEPDRSTMTSGGDPARDFIRFYFVKSSADLTEHLPLWKEEFEHCDSITNSDAAEARVGAYCKNFGMKWSTDQQAAATRNLLAYCTAKSWFERDDDARIRLLVLGHASDELFQVKHPPYSSNTELAHSRAAQTRVVLNRLADEVERSSRRSLHGRIQCEVIGGASEHATLDQKTAPPDHLNLTMSAEVERQVFRDVAGPAPAVRRSAVSELDLLDYCYFMIYTVTTTGYGDLIPATPRTKFAVSLANLIEVLYLPIIFVLIVMKRS